MPAQRPPSPPVDPFPGKMVGNFRLARRLGAGGMGAVYEGIHPIIGSRVAVKLLGGQQALDPDVVERFFSEARVLNQVQHDNIVKVIDLGRHPEGFYYCVMELLEGETLAQAIGRGRIPLPRALRILVQSCDALAAAHDKGIVHRDLKPANIMLVTGPSGAEQTKLVDFGIAKLFGAARPAMPVSATASTVVGTPAYMSPEQASGRAGEVDTRSDLYSLGLVAYEMLTGHHPWEGMEVGQIILAQLTKEPPPPSVWCEVPPRLEKAVLQAVAKQKQDRFPTAEAFGLLLRDILAEVDASGAPASEAKASVPPVARDSAPATPPATPPTAPSAPPPGAPAAAPPSSFILHPSSLSTPSPGAPPAAALPSSFILHPSSLPSSSLPQTPRPGPPTPQPGAARTTGPRMAPLQVLSAPTAPPAQAQAPGRVWRFPQSVTPSPFSTPAGAGSGVRMAMRRRPAARLAPALYAVALVGVAAGAATLLLGRPERAVEIVGQRLGFVPREPARLPRREPHQDGTNAAFGASPEIASCRGPFERFRDATLSSAGGALGESLARRLDAFDRLSGCLDPLRQPPGKASWAADYLEGLAAFEFAESLQALPDAARKDAAELRRGDTEPFHARLYTGQARERFDRARPTAPESAHVFIDRYLDEAILLGNRVQ